MNLETKRFKHKETGDYMEVLMANDGLGFFRWRPTSEDGKPLSPDFAGIMTPTELKQSCTEVKTKGKDKLEGARQIQKKRIKLKFPATRVVHWATGPVHCCEQHAKGLLVIGGILGGHTPVTPSDGLHECSNCVNEAKVKKEPK